MSDKITIMDLKPKSIYCPICGKRHDWKGKELGFHDEQHQYKYVCHDSQNSIFVDEYKCIRIRINLPQNCRKVRNFDETTSSHIHYTFDTRTILGLGRIEYENGSPIIRVHFDAEVFDYIGRGICSTRKCSCYSSCRLVEKWESNDFKYKEEKIAVFEDSEDSLKEELMKFKKRILRLELKFEFNKEDIDGLNSQNAEKSKATGKNKKVRKSKEKSLGNEFNDNMEIGLNQDKNIANTDMGIAVKKGSGWRIFNNAENTINEVRNIQIEKFPIFILPITKLSKGDLIKYNGAYYYVINVRNEDIEAVNAKSGKIEKIISKYNCYLKAVALNDYQNTQLNLLVMFTVFKEELGENNNDMMKTILEMIMNKKNNS